LKLVETIFFIHVYHLISMYPSAS